MFVLPVELDLLSLVRRHSRARYVVKRVSAGVACVETRVLNISVKLAASRDLSRILD